MPNERGPWGAAPPQPIKTPQLPPGLARILAVGGFAIVAIAALLLSSFYVVEPTEMAGVRRFGTVITDKPVGPGLHFKLPFVDVVDTIQTSLDTLNLSNLTVYTIDNQAVTVSLGVSYRIPATAVLKLLYQVGRTGDVDITENIRPILSDRVLRVFATQSTVSISANREQITAQITKNVTQALSSIFGLEITDLQLSAITYSPSFQASVEAAVQAKNDAIRAENTVTKVQYEGEQAKVQAAAQAAVRIAQANGDAEAAIAQARAQREASILQAEGTAQATMLTGEAQAKIIQQVGSAVAANPGVVAYETAHRWNGMMPATMLGSGSNPLTMLNLPPADPSRTNAENTPK